MITRAWSMPNRWTFRMMPVKLLFDKYVLNLGANWADPFCGSSMTAQHRNDLDPNNKFAKYNMKASEFLAQSSARNPPPQSKKKARRNDDFTNQRNSS